MIVIRLRLIKNWDSTLYGWFADEVSKIMDLLYRFLFMPVHVLYESQLKQYLLKSEDYLYTLTNQSFCNVATDIFRLCAP